MKKIIVPAFFVLFIILAFLYKWPDLQNYALRLMYAVIAYYVSVFVKDSDNPILAVLLTVVWFLFYPNTFYLLTQYSEFADLSSIYQPGLDMMNFYLRMGSILFGVLCGVISLQNIANRFKMNINFRMGFFIAVTFVASILLLISPEGNIDSWQWVTNPLTLRERIRGFAINRDNLYFILGYTALQMMCLLLMDKED